MPCLSGFSFTTRVQRRDSLNVPLLRFNPPSRFVPVTSVLLLSAQDNSHGIFVPLQCVRHREFTSFRLTGRLSGSARRPPQRPPVVPKPPATVPLTGFFNLSATCPSQYRPAIFRQVALMGFALQGVMPSTKPSAIHHRRNTLLPLLP